MCIIECNILHVISLFLHINIVCDGPYDCQCTCMSRDWRECICSVLFMCVTAIGSENLLAGLGKCHPGKGRGEGFRVHLAARALQVIILPRLCVRRLKHQSTKPDVIILSWSTCETFLATKSSSCMDELLLFPEEIAMECFIFRFLSAKKN